MREEPGRPLIATLTDHLKDRHTLLLQDSSEHLVAVIADLARPLLRACSHLRILATSRVVLSRSTLTRVVDRLEAAGPLTRQRVATDRRGAYAVLTEQGAEALRTAWPIYAQGIHEHFARHLADDEVPLLTAALGRVDAAARRG